MDIKTKLENEKLFLGRNSLFFQTLNKKGIYTVEDFINLDIDKISSGSYKRKQNRAYQEILKYKYLNTPLILDVLLDNEYDRSAFSCKKIYKDMTTLGFGECFFPSFLEKLFENSDCIKMIDIITNFKFNSMDALKRFYIDYYNTKINKETKEETIIDIDKSSLDTLKNELVNLLNQRNELDIQISTLMQQINTLEGGRSINGKK